MPAKQSKKKVAINKKGVELKKSKKCPEFSMLNPITKKCNKIKKPFKGPCQENYIINPVTGKCNKIPQKKVKTVVVPKKIPSVKQTGGIRHGPFLPCKSGFERNPLTGRCKKTIVISVPASSTPTEVVIPTETEDYWAKGMKKAEKKEVKKEEEKEKLAEMWEAY